ncbi:MAG: hypothetical protein JHD16_09485 [Solirubrobacteraceae bacterium]|nr:hypothetical protein [Solirubrobacteraceae bacterium]
MFRRHLHARGLVAAVLVSLFLSVAVAAPEGAAMLLPAFLLAFAVALGLFTGDELIRRLRRHLRSARTPQIQARRPAGLHRRPRRVGLSLAFALAMRPPPARAVALTS